MNDIQKSRQIILLSKRDKTVTPQLEFCLTKMWYNLLVINTLDFNWKNNMSENCIAKCRNYFNQKNINLK